MVGPGGPEELRMSSSATFGEAQALPWAPASKSGLAASKSCRLGSLKSVCVSLSPRCRQAGSSYPAKHIGQQKGPEEPFSYYPDFLAHVRAECPSSPQCPHFCGARLLLLPRTVAAISLSIWSRLSSNSLSFCVSISFSLEMGGPPPEKRGVQSRAWLSVSTPLR